MNYKANNLHDGFIDKGSFEYKHAKASTRIDLYMGSLFAVFVLALAVALTAAFVVATTPIPPQEYWMISLQLLGYAVVSWIFLRRYFIRKRTTYGLERNL